MLDLRPEVRAFAEAMERTLRENDHKGGWKDCDLSWLLRRLDDEKYELCMVLLRLDEPPGRNRAKRERVVREAADVANFAMMIADNCGGLDRDEDDGEGTLGDRSPRVDPRPGLVAVERIHGPQPCGQEPPHLADDLSDWEKENT